MLQSSNDYFKVVNSKLSLKSKTFSVQSMSDVVETYADEIIAAVEPCLYESVQCLQELAEVSLIFCSL